VEKIAMAVAVVTAAVAVTAVAVTAVTATAVAARTGKKKQTVTFFFYLHQII
jgi:hypothetical protein